MRTMRFRTLGSVFFLLATIFSPAHADENACPSNAVHCAYFSGISDGLNDGRYIKLSNASIGSIVLCFNGTSSVSMSQSGAGKYLGANSDTYSICTDANGTNCEKVGVDNFSVSQGENGFVAKPKLFNMDLSATKDKYPACGFAVGQTYR